MLVLLAHLEFRVVAGEEEVLGPDDAETFGPGLGGGRKAQGGRRGEWSRGASAYAATFPGLGFGLFGLFEWLVLHTG